MGGGDLNTKKSWHPNTMKNQERVWKAEQAAAEEKKKILELQRERELEHDRTQLNEMAQRNFGALGAGGDNKLHWMYDKPNKQAQHEDYLLGKALGKSDESEQQQNTIPAVNRRVIGSSMLSSTDDSQVDLARKMREDPLLLVKERERAARAALLNNPLQRKRIAELLRQEQEQKESSTRKKSKKKEKDLDKLLASKLNALGTDKGINLASLLNSDGSSYDSSSDEEPKKKKKKKVKQKKKKKKKSKGDSDTSDKDDKRHRDKSHSKKTKTKEKSSRYDNDFDIPNRKELENIKKKQDSTKEISKRDKEPRKRRSSENEKDDQVDKKRKKKRNENDTDSEIEDKKRDANKNSKEATNRGKESRKRHSSEIEKPDRSDKKKKKKHYETDTDSETDQKKRDISKDGKQTSSEGRRNDHERRRAISPIPAKRQEKDRKEKRKGLSSEERAARLAEMAAAGAQHEADRGRRVARQRAADSAAEATPRTGPFKNEARALPDSLESRIHSNRHYIQRDKTHMDKHFARR